MFRLKRVLLGRNTPPTLPRPPGLKAKETPRIQIAQQPAKRRNVTRPSLARKLGAWAIFALTGGLLVIIAAYVFLTFLWAPGNTHTLWKKIIFSGWATRAVTITALAIRWAVSVQAGVCTAMLAAIALEGGEVVLLHAAAISGTRYVTASPHETVLFLLRDRRQAGLALGFALAILLVTTLSQFVSTILLSDFRDRNIVGNSRYEHLHTQDAVYYEFTDFKDTANYLNSRPQFYSRFAEYHEDVRLPNAQMMHGTGMTLRAFLPFLDTQIRSRVSSYAGRATVFDTSVTCLRPNASFDVGLGNKGPEIILNGSIGLPESIFGIGGWRHDFAVWSPWLKEPGFDSYTQEWGVSLTQLGGRQKNPFSASRSSQGLVYLAVNQSLTGYGDNGSFLSNGWIRASDFRQQSNREWADFIFDYSSGDQFKLSLSLCYTPLLTFSAEVYARAHNNCTEPSLEYDRLGHISTSSIRAQLELGGQPTNQKRDRGYMELTFDNKTLLPREAWLPNETALSNETWLLNYSDSPNSLSTYALESWQANTSYIFCNTCYGIMIYNDQQYVSQSPFQASKAKLHPAHVALFHDTLKSTGHPAVAMQSLLTTIFSYCYYDQFATAVDGWPAEYTLYLTVLAPGLAHKGFVIVLAILGAHLALVAAVVTLFHRRSKWSLLGNAWQTVSQTACLAGALVGYQGSSAATQQGSTTEPDPVRKVLFETSQVSTDKEVEKMLKFSGSSGRDAVILAQLDGTDKVGLRFRGHRGKTGASHES